eukprot:6384014-Amphidinium_carterae.1
MAVCRIVCCDLRSRTDGSRKAHTCDLKWKSAIQAQLKVFEDSGAVRRRLCKMKRHARCQGVEVIVLPSVAVCVLKTDTWRRFNIRPWSMTARPSLSLAASTPDPTREHCD